MPGPILPVGASDPFSAFNVEFNHFIPPLDAPQALSGPDAHGLSFGDILKNAVDEVQSDKNAAEKLTFDYATGKPVDVHQVMIAVAKASVEVQVTSTIVSKAANGINQLLQTQV